MQRANPHSRYQSAQSASHQLLRLVWLLALVLSLCGCTSGSVQPTSTSSGSVDKQSASAESVSTPTTVSQVERVRVPLAQAAIDWNKGFGTRIPTTAPQIAERLEGIFKVPRSELKPGVLVFPVTDDKGAVRADGIGLSYQSLIVISKAAAKTKLMIYPEVAQDLLIEAGCHRQGSVLTKELREACLRSLDAQFSVSATLTRQDIDWKLQVSFHDPAGELRGMPHQHRVARGKLNTIPGIIASHVCDRLEIKLTDEERGQLMQPQVGTDEDSVWLGQLLSTHFHNHESYAKAERFLQSNPQCLAGWRAMFSNANNPYALLKWYLNTESAPKDPRLDLYIASSMLSIGYDTNPISEIQRVAVTLPGDRAVGLNILLCIMQTGDMELLDRALDLWRKQDPSYMARYARGRFLVEMANYVNPVSADPETEPEVAERNNRWLNEARAELEAAVEINPLGWQAHNLLISLATAQRRSHDEVERHFRAVTSVVPGNVSAYRRKLLSLAPVYGGSIDGIAAFAEECVRTERWDEGIPQLMVEAVDLATCDPKTAATSFTAFRNERLWQAIKAYFASAERQPWQADYRQAFNCFALWAANSGHAKEAASHFRTLSTDYSRSIYERAVFQSYLDYHFLKALSLTDGGTLATDQELAIGLKLSHGDLDGAEALLEQPQDKAYQYLLPIHRTAVALGRRLFAERRLELSQEELFDVIIDEESPPTSRHRGTLASEDGGLRWISGGTFNTFNFYFPVGIRHGVISGQLQLTGGIQRFGILLHTRALRDVVTVMYLPSQQRVSVSRSRRELASFPLPQGVIPFRFEFGAQEDVLEPVPGQQLRTPVIDDVPSGFAFEGAGDRSTPGAVKIMNVKIELKE
jgi:hypothetical protein